MTGQRGARQTVARPARMIMTAPRTATARQGAPAMTTWPEDPAMTTACAALPGEVPLVVDPPRAPPAALALAAESTAEAPTPVVAGAAAPAPRTASKAPNARLATALVAITAARQASAAIASALASGTSSWPVTEKSWGGSGRGPVKTACAHGCRTASTISPAPAALSSSTSTNSLRITGISDHRSVHRSVHGLGRFARHRLEGARVEARAVASVAGRTDLVDLDHQGIAVAIQCHRFHPLLMPGRVALHPV